MNKMRDFYDYVVKNRDVLEQAINIDNEKWNDKKAFKNVFDKKIFMALPEPKKTYLTLYEGNIAVTYSLLDEALSNNSNLVLTINDEFLATNTVLVSIANKFLQENKKDLFIKLYNNIEDDKILKSTEKVDCTLLIGHEENYEKIIKNSKGRIKKIEL